MRDQHLLHRILDSVRVVTVDTHGCATARESMKLKRRAQKMLLPAEATELSICYFDQDQQLRTSALLEKSEATTLIDLLNRAEPGRNPDVSTHLCLEEPVDSPMRCWSLEERATVHWSSSRFQVARAAASRTAARPRG